MISLQKGWVDVFITVNKRKIWSLKELCIDDLINSSWCMLTEFPLRRLLNVKPQLINSTLLEKKKTQTITKHALCFSCGLQLRMRHPHLGGLLWAYSREIRPCSPLTSNIKDDEVKSDSSNWAINYLCLLLTEITHHCKTINTYMCAKYNGISHI